MNINLVENSCVFLIITEAKNTRLVAASRINLARYWPKQIRINQCFIPANSKQLSIKALSAIISLVVQIRLSKFTSQTCSPPKLPTYTSACTACHTHTRAFGVHRIPAE